MSVYYKVENAQLSIVSFEILEGGVRISSLLW